MENQVLSIEQMKHLKELGVDTSKASMYWALPSAPNYRINLNIVGVRGNLKASEDYGYSIGAFTLQDMLALMPKEISTNLEGYTRLEPCYLMIDFADNSIFYECLTWDRPERAVEFEDKNILTSTYEMLCWLAENGHLKQQP